MCSPMPDHACGPGCHCISCCPEAVACPLDDEHMCTCGDVPPDTPEGIHLAVDTRPILFLREERAEGELRGDPRPCCRPWSEVRAELKLEANAARDAIIELLKVLQSPPAPLALRPWVWRCTEGHVLKAHRDRRLHERCTVVHRPGAADASRCAGRLYWAMRQIGGGEGLARYEAQYPDATVRPYWGPQGLRARYGIRSAADAVRDFYARVTLGTPALCRRPFTADVNGQPDAGWVCGLSVGHDGRCSSHGFREADLFPKIN